MRDITLGETIDFKFTTTEPDTGAPATLAGTPVISAYVGNSLTQITAGITLTVDFDGVTGLHNVRVVATSGNGYSDNSDVALVITTGTVDAVSAVGYKVAEFTIGRAAAYSRLGAPAGASVSADVAAVKVDTAAILVDTGTTLDARIPAALVGGRMDASVGAMAANVMTAAAAAADLTTELQNGLATAAALTTIDGKIDTIDTNVDSILADTGTDGVVVAAGSKTGYALSTSGNEAVADQVWDEAASGHVASGSFGQRLNLIRAGTAQAGDATHITLDASASAVNDFYNNQQIFITAGTGAGQGRIISDYVGATKVAEVATWATNPSSDSVFVITPFGSIPGASAPTAGEVADAVWDEPRGDHVAADSFGQASAVLRSGTAQAGGASTITLDASASATNDLYNYNMISIIAGTGAGQSRQITDYVGSSKVATVGIAWAVNPSSDSVFLIFPLGVDAATVAAIADAVWDEARSGHTTAGSFGEYTNADVLRLSGDATAADNAEAFFDGTGYAGTNNVIPSVTTVTGNVNGSVGSLVGHTVQTGDAFARLGAPAGASVSADIAAVKVDTAAAVVDTNELQTDLTNGGRLDLLIDGIKAKTDSLTFTAAGVVDANVERVNAQDIGASKPYNTAT